MPSVDLPAHIFRAYDIRGKIGADINPDRVRLIARTFALDFLPEPRRVVLARDLRESSKELAAAALDGLLDAGAEVWDIGVVPSPLGYFAAGRWQASGAVVLTASHRPPDENGMKLRLGDRPFFGDGLQDLYQRAITAPSGPGGGTHTERDPYPEYFEAALKYVKLAGPLRVVLDLGNGAGLHNAPRLLSALGCDLDVLFGDDDGGRFLGRGPDPTLPGAMDALSARVCETGADLGIALDADGDRIAVVDEHGKFLGPDLAAIPFCRDMLRDGPDVFVTDVRCTRSTHADVEAHGGRLEMARCGYPFILSRMDELSAAMGFETTGHYYFRNPDIKFDDATFAAAVLCSILSRAGQSLGAIIDSAPVFYPADEERWPCPDDVKFQVVDRLGEVYAAEHDILKIDGVRIERPDGWALVRASNTAQELTLRWEGDSPDARDQIGCDLTRRVAEVLAEFGLTRQT
jgi:phosphomannomutase/phosphoglucomutase